MNRLKPERVYPRLKDIVSLSKHPIPTETGKRHWLSSVIKFCNGRQVRVVGRHLVGKAAVESFRKRGGGPTSDNKKREGKYDQKFQACIKKEVQKRKERRGRLSATKQRR